MDLEKFYLQTAYLYLINLTFKYTVTKTMRGRANNPRLLVSKNNPFQIQKTLTTSKNIKMQVSLKISKCKIMD